MSRLRITQIEIEDGGEGVFRAAIESLSRRAPEPTPSPAQVVFEDRERKQIEKEKEPERAAPQREPVRRAAKKQLTAPAAPQPAKDPAGYVSISDRIVAALKKKPMSSLELSGFLKLEPKQIYTPCFTLKKQGLIDSKTDDDAAGVRRYYVK